MAPADLALFIEAKLQAVALKFDYRTFSFEVGLAEGTDLDKVIEAGLEWKGRVFAIEKPYAPQEEFFDLCLTGLLMLCCLLPPVLNHCRSRTGVLYI